MKIISWNVNGLRAVERKGELSRFIHAEKPDLLLIQETKGQPDQLAPFQSTYPDYLQYYNSAEKKGYSGTSAWLHKDFECTIDSLEFSNTIPNAPNADEGRLSQLSFQLDGQNWDILGIYFPNGGKSEQAWQEKLVFYDRTHDYMNLLKNRGRMVLVGGDMNVAHNEIDLARPKENEGNIGFHPSERAWMDRLHEDGWIDTWRYQNPTTTDVYSWWHMISRSRPRNIGWRIDYFLMHQDSLDRAGPVTYMNNQMGSDHCPIRIILEI